LGIVSAGLNKPTYLDDIKLIFDAVDSAVTIVFAQLKPSQICGNFINFSHGHGEPGTLKSAIDSAGLNAPTNWDVIK
jgi:hypothetical protein